MHDNIPPQPTTGSVCQHCGPGPVNYTDPLTCMKCGRVISTPSFTTLDLTKAAPLTPLKEAWESYRARVIPADAPPIQIQESRRAFYAGAQAFMAACANATNATEDRVVNGMCGELHQFAQDVLAGRA